MSPEAEIAAQAMMAARAAAIDEVCGLLDKEAEKSRDNSDLETAGLIDMLRAKVKALVKG